MADSKMFYCCFIIAVIRKEVCMAAFFYFPQSLMSPFAHEKRKISILATHLCLYGFQITFLPLKMS